MDAAGSYLASNSVAYPLSSEEPLIQEEGGNGVETWAMPVLHAAKLEAV